MDRHSVWKKMALALAAAAVAVSTVGCTSLLLTAVYLFKGNDEDAKFDGLVGEKVAVVCRPMVSLQDSGANVSRELAKQVGALLEAKVTKIKVVNEQKIVKWTDKNYPWEEYTEVGRGVKAEIVVGINIESFQTIKAQTLLQGNSKVRLVVYDCKTRKLLFEEHLPQYVYPPNNPVEMSVQSEPEFRAHYIHALAERIGLNFYPHDRYYNIAGESEALAE